jgi:hypothetical protein
MRLPRLDTFARRYTAARLTLGGIAIPLLGLLHGCTMIVDADEYNTCTAGTEACKCMPDDRCDEGLECRLPGLCVLAASPVADR